MATPTRKQSLIGVGALVVAVAVGIGATLVVQNVNEEGPSTTTVKGQLQVAIAMGEPVVVARVVEADGSVTPLEVPSGQNTEVLAADQQEVKVTGTEQSDGDLQVKTVDSLTANAPPTAQITPKNLHIAFVLLHNPGSTAEPWTPEQVNTQMFGPATNSPANWFRNVSANQITVDGSVFGWWTPTSTTTCDLWNYQQSAASQATAHGVNLSAYNYVVVITPGIGCAWAGIAYVGSGGVHLNGTITQSVTEHELGHNYGAWHSGQEWCLPATTCSLSDYGDQASVMGSGNQRNYSAFHLNVMGWLPPAAKIAANVGDTVTLTGLEDPTGPGTKLVTVGNYAFDFRNGTGYDLDTPNPPYPQSVQGVHVYTTTRKSTDDEWIAQWATTPWPLPNNQVTIASTLQVGATKTAPDGITFTLVSQTFGASGTAVVKIGSGTPPPPPTTTPPPTVTTIPPTTTSTTIAPPPPPGAVGYTTGDDSDGPGAAYASFKLAQTFSSPTAVSVTKADALLFRRGNAGNATCNVYATNAAGLPTATRVTQGRVAMTPSPGTAPAWTTCTFLTPLNMIANTKYALVIQWSGGNGNNGLFWRADASSPTYAGGQMFRSRSSGAWDATSPFPMDAMFRVYS